MAVMTMPRRFTPILGAAALGAAAAGVAVDLILPGQWYALAVYGAAAVLALWWSVAARRTIGAWLRRRSTRMGAHSALVVAIVSAVLVMLNILAVRHDARLDLSQTGAFTLAPQSVKVIESLTHDVKVTAFFPKGSADEVTFKDLINTYRHYTDKISSNVVDPDAHPATAKQYGVTQETIILASGGREARIRTVSEQEVTNALIRVSKERRKRIAILDGHGEPGLTDTEAGGLSLAKEALERQGYDVVPVVLAQEGSVPAETTVLVAADPQKPLLPAEVEAIGRYMAEGGRILLALGPGPLTGLEALAAGWGVTFRGDTVIDPISQLFGGDYTTLAIRSYGEHLVVKDFRLVTYFPLAQSVVFQGGTVAGIDYQAIARSSTESWGETQIVGGKARFDAGIDVRGPLDLAAAVSSKTAPLPEGETDAKSPAWRAIVAGNGRFATNRFFNAAGNGDLFTAAINWLAEDQELIAIRPKEGKSSPLLLTAGQQRVVFWLPVWILPGAISAYGLHVWRRRRRL
ncbi:MAG: Gldg family protein [Nitrospiria bacterium]